MTTGRDNSFMGARANRSEDSAGGRRNTLGLDIEGVKALASRLDSLDVRPGGELKRDFVRWPFRHERVRIQIDQPGGSQLMLRLACRNISRGGISLFHSCYLHERGRCTTWLPHPQKGEVGIFGTLVRCKHRGGIVHELGVRFDKPIDAREYVSLDAGSEIFSQERVTAESLCGTLLLVEPDEQQQRLMRHFLRETKIRLRCVASQTEALAALREPMDLIFTNSVLPDGSGTELVSAIRAVGVRSPVVVITPDATRRSRLEARGSVCDGVLGKPLSCDRVLRAVAEFLGGPGRSALGRSSTSIGANDPGADVVPEFIEQLHQSAGEMREAIEKDDATACERLCMMIIGAAPALGFASIVPPAERAVQMLQWTKSAKESAVVLADVISICEQARAA
ncbi:MAG: response regulator [Phycisphaerales bacterium]|nr:response regulator [Planctomycetota bacterium]